MRRHRKHFVYIIQDRYGDFYTGCTTNIERRIVEHNQGVGARYLRGRLPIKLIFVKEYRYFKNALSAEKRLKKYPKHRKEELIKIYQSKIATLKSERGGTHA